MKIVTRTLAGLAIAATALMVAPESQAQIEGYQFGVGINYANRGNNGFGLGRSFFGAAIAPTPRVDQPPFFALYPPVYYDQTIVARPYGVSPFAAPVGIRPVEMSAPKPQVQTNPFYKGPQQEHADNANDNPVDSQSTTWAPNPFSVDRATAVADNR